MRSLRSKVAIGYLVCIALAIAGSALVYHALDLSEAAALRLTTVGKVVDAGRRLSGAVAYAVTGEQSFAVTGTPASLNLYTVGIKEYDAADADLRGLVRSPALRGRLGRIEVLFAQWQTQVAEPEI